MSAGTDPYATGHADGYQAALYDITAETDRCTSVHATRRVLEQLRYQYLDKAGAV